MAKTAIKADQLVIVYNKGKSNEFNALNHINAEIFAHEYIILFGPSGCGKSTLLYTILGGNVPDSGHMYVNNEDIFAYTPAEMNKYQQGVIGIVYQAFNLISSISVLENVALPMTFLNKGLRERSERGSELLRRFGIPERLEDKLPTFMSGGQMQRVAVARALVNDPEILLADEPVGNLDSISAKHVMESFDEINQRDRKTVILVTHNAAHLPYAHRVFYMRDGVLRRVAVNPEKEQIQRLKPGETIVTEVEQLNRLYPYNEPIELKVKSLVNFATQTIGFRQLERLENVLLGVVKGITDEQMLYDQLVRSKFQNGIGMVEEEARFVTKKVFGVLKTSDSVRRFREIRTQDDMFIHQQKYIDSVIEFLNEGVGVASTQDQLKMLRGAVADRMAGLIGGDEFAERLNYTQEMGGGSYSEREAVLISRHLEKLIAQGAYIIQANELVGAHS